MLLICFDKNVFVKYVKNNNINNINCYNICCCVLSCIVKCAV